MFEAEADEKGIEFLTRFDEEVSEEYLGDKDRIQQIFMSLIGNAIKFTSKGSVQVTINSINENPDESVLEFKVSDSGIGIPEDRLDDIFNLISQADLSYTREYRGSGLGLALCDKLLRLTRGNISVVSVLDKGTTFTVKIPFTRQRES